MCPSHRKSILAEVRARLDQVPAAPTLCISTQLIEAGVDVDFGSVIRFTAGLDSIAQAAGRCNRNGREKLGFVHVVNPRAEDENLDMLPDIQIGRSKAERVLDDYEADPEKFGYNRIGPQAMTWYYKNYFFARAGEMCYPISARQIGHFDTLLNLLSDNTVAVADYKRTKREAPAICLRQAFMTAAKAFKAIDAPTRGVIVPYSNDGKELINDLCAAYLPDKEFELLRRAQQFSVNVFPNVLEKLSKDGVVREIREGTGILYLTDSRYYSPEFGLSETPQGNMEVLYVAS
jgi:CRISPR-associated endonuclease/helicase Cas3